MKIGTKVKVEFNDFKAEGVFLGEINVPRSSPLMVIKTNRICYFTQENQENCSGAPLLYSMNNGGIFTFNSSYVKELE
jgi:hypothetical protein